MFVTGCNRAKLRWLQCIRLRKFASFPNVVLLTLLALQKAYACTLSRLDGQMSGRGNLPTRSTSLLLWLVCCKVRLFAVFTKHQHTFQPSCIFTSCTLLSYTSVVSHFAPCLAWLQSCCFIPVGGPSFFIILSRQRVALGSSFRAC